MSVFDTVTESMFLRTRVTLRFHERLVGGCPKDPQLVEGWLRAGLGITDEQELFHRMKQHLVEMGAEVADAVTMQDLVDASKTMAGELKTQGFKRDEDGNPYIEARQIKAAIKENVNILFAGERWGKTGKGPKGYTAERVFVGPHRIVVGSADEIGIDQSIGHLTGPKGPYSTIGLFEYVEQPTIEFELRELIGGESQEPALKYDQWAKVWSLMQLNGIGTMRSQGHGTFAVIEYEQDARPTPKRAKKTSEAAPVEA